MQSETGNGCCFDVIERQVKKYGDKFHVTAYRLNR